MSFRTYIILALFAVLIACTLAEEFNENLGADSENHNRPKRWYGYGGMYRPWGMGGFYRPWGMMGMFPGMMWGR